MPQHIHVIDAVRPSSHTRNQTAHLQIRIHPSRPADPHMPPSQTRQPTAVRQSHHWYQARPRHKIPVTKRRVRFRQIV